MAVRGSVLAVVMVWGLAASASAQPAPVPGRDQAEQAAPTSVERVREGLAREPGLRLDTRPIFRVEVTEYRPRHWDLQSQFLFTSEPRTTTTRWHDEFVSMTTPDEARMFSPMFSASETAMVAATSLLFAGAAALVNAGFSEWRDRRHEGRVRAARIEVDAALRAWEAANRPPR